MTVIVSPTTGSLLLTENLAVGFVLTGGGGGGSTTVITLLLLDESTPLDAVTVIVLSPGGVE